MPPIKGFPDALVAQALDDAMNCGAALPVLAISGLQGSGKSTLAAQVVALAETRGLRLLRLLRLGIPGVRLLLPVAGVRLLLRLRIAGLRLLRLLGLGLRHGRRFERHDRSFRSR